jgi:predicted ATPase
MSGQRVLVGRVRELARLGEHLEAASRGQGGVVLVSSEPGIGKTRLLQAMAADARTRGIAVMWGRCFEGESAPPYAPWIVALGDAVRLVGPDHSRAVLSKASGLVASLIRACTHPW